MTDEPLADEPMADERVIGEPAFDEPADDLGTGSRRPITARGVAIVGGRAVAGLVGIGVAVATIAASAFLPLPTVGSTPASELVTPVPTAQQLVCPGAFLRLSDETGQDATTSSAIGLASIRFASSSSSVDSTPLELSDASTGGTAAAPSVISAPPDAADPAAQVLLSGAQSESVDEDDFVGLAAGECGVASGDIWLAGGSTATGRTTLLSLSNPTEVPATVDLQLFGETGAVAAPGTSGIIVPARGQRVLSLAGFQPGVVSPVVHVTSTGGQVVAELQQSTVRGLDPGGVDIVGPTAAPSTDNVIPGLLVTDPAALQLLGGNEGYDDLGTVLRLFAPGEGSVPITVSVIPEDAADAGTSFALDIDAGKVVDVPVAELETGSYTVRVSSESPLVAAARVSSAQGAANDFAWLSSSVVLEQRAQFTAAPGPSPVVHLSNPTTAPVTVTLTASTGDDLSVDIAAGASALLPVEAGTTYELGGFDRLFAAITLSEGASIARYPVHPPGEGSAPIRVYP